LHGLRNPVTWTSAANPEDRVGRQGQEIETAGNILAEYPRANVKPPRREFVEQFLMDEMDLPEIGLGRVGSDPRTVPYRLAHMGIALNPRDLPKV
jgi:hypothetical protein